MRYIESWIAPAIPILQAYNEILNGLLSWDTILSNSATVTEADAQITKNALENMARESQAYLRNARFLADRLAAMSELISAGLALKGQRASREQNDHLTALSNATRQDSATIRVITVATLIFLPTTFVSVRVQLIPLGEALLIGNADPFRSTIVLPYARA